MSKKTLLTIWDIDKTFYNGYSIIDFGVYLEKIGEFESGFEEMSSHLKEGYKEGKISYEHFAQAIYNLYGGFIKDHNLYKVLQLSKDFWKEAVKNVYPAALELHKYLTSKGSEHMAISGSSFESLYYLFDQFNFVKVKTTQYEVIDGNFTDKIVSTLVSHFDKSRQKDKVLNQKNKYEKLIGIGDNMADLSFLELVDVPIVMGKSDKALVDIATQKDWLIIEDPMSGNIEVLRNKI
jgi:phosphoserine phosphatase